MIVVASFGIVFGILGIFTIGIVFVPLAALCGLLALIGGIAQGRFSTAFLGIIAGVLGGVGFAVSPSLWLAAAAIIGAPR